MAPMSACSRLRTHPLAIVALIGALFALSCGDKAKPKPGATCLLNSDCNDPLSCTFSRCHTTCMATRDCPAGQRCVKVAGGNICQLAEEKMCPPSKTCMDPLICAADVQCRGKCLNAGDCPTGQVCAAGGACAEPGEVTADGKLMAVTSGGVDGAAPPVTGSDAAADAAISGGSDVAAALGPCGVPENEPNNTRDQATPLSPMALVPACLGTTKDVDWYELTAPSDPGGGFVLIDVSEVGEITPQLEGYTVSDNGLIETLYNDSPGSNMNAFLAVASGQKYRLVFSGFAEVGKAPAKYTLKTTYTKVDDRYEPNDTRATAKPITAGMPIMAYLHAGHRSARITPDDVADWYTVTLAAGTATVKLVNVPTNLTAVVEVYDGAGKMLIQAFGPNNGANVDKEATIVTPGPHQVMVTSFSLAPDGFGKSPRPTVVPDSYTRSYTLTIAQ